MGLATKPRFAEKAYRLKMGLATKFQNDPTGRKCHFSI